MMQLDLQLAFTRKEAGIASVMENNREWAYEAKEALKQLYPSLPKEFTCDDVRELITPRAGNPKHVNAWGGLISGFIKEGIFEWTEKVDYSHREKAKVRKIQVYRWRT
jgi:hypothetical protein